MKRIANIDSVTRPLVCVRYCLGATNASSKKSKSIRSIDSVGLLHRSLFVEGCGGRPEIMIEINNNEEDDVRRREASEILYEFNTNYYETEVGEFHHT